MDLLLLRLVFEACHTSMNARVSILCHCLACMHVATASHLAGNPHLTVHHIARPWFNYICDRICEKVHSSHIQFFKFGDSYNLLGMLDRYETFRDCRTTIPLCFLKISILYTIHCGFYRSPNTQNQMCELCTFSQIRSNFVTV